jgi:hypothetical protein
MNTSTLRSIRSGDKVARDVATLNQGTVQLGDAAPAFVRPIRSGDKVAREVATLNQGTVQLGDAAPAFVR